MSQQTARRGKRFADLVAEAKPQIQEVSKETLQAWLQTGVLPDGRPFTVLDVREPDEVAGGVIAKANGDQTVVIPRGQLEYAIDDVLPDQDTPIVCYCRGGNRSALAAKTLQEMGYPNVWSLAGGWRNWSA
ncbi:MAG: rhodanese-like domain-containing protein [Vampirovibrionales bacterium]|nr:rhodanese-like domain-containing protein [Vampirovibrionales bacterium]